MAVYKVIQNVEAEDKLVGPLTLKQFIYAMIAMACIFINFKLFLSPELGILRILFIIMFSLPMILFGVLAAPLGRDQPTELWLLSHIQFMLRPRKRTWNQLGEIESVQITAPKRTAPNLTKNLSQGEAKSRLNALASMLDSRGWAIAATPEFQAANQQLAFQEDDRLVGTDTLVKEAPMGVDVRADDDVLDERNNATAQRYGALIRKVEEQKKQALRAKLSNRADAPNESESKKSAKSESPIWGIQNINPIAVFKPDEPGTVRVQHNEAPTESERSLDERLKAAETALHAQHPQYQQAESLDAERARRADRKQNLAASGNYTVATLATMANADTGQIKSMPI